jgi:hypothetical protein
MEGVGFIFIAGYTRPVRRSLAPRRTAPGLNSAMPHWRRTPLASIKSTTKIKMKPRNRGGPVKPAGSYALRPVNAVE